jgi:lysine 2,3-aminomutase
VKKVSFRVNYDRWREAFAYIAAHPELEDIVISGGDVYNLRPEQLEAIGFTLLDIPHIRRIRLATKGLAVMPQKVLTHTEWLEAVTRINRHSRKLHKEMVIHTHFNHPSEITWITREMMDRLFDLDIRVRNQSVLLRGVNDTPEVMSKLVHHLTRIHIQPYYVYLCDMVQGVEGLRTSLAKAIELEKKVRGITAGFNTPRFVCDTPGGGGKRSVHSYEYYNPETGISIYSSPVVKPGQLFLYYDPLHSLSEKVRRRWQDPGEHDKLVAEAMQHLGD